MKPLKQTTALTAFATSSFLFVPSALAEGSSGAATASAATAAAASTVSSTGIVEPIAIAVASAVAVVGFAGWGMESRKRRQIEEERYMNWMQCNLTGAWDGAWGNPPASNRDLEHGVAHGLGSIVAHGHSDVADREHAELAGRNHGGNGSSSSTSEPGEYVPKHRVNRASGVEVLSVEASRRAETSSRHGEAAPHPIEVAPQRVDGALSNSVAIRLDSIIPTIGPSGAMVENAHSSKDAGADTQKNQQATVLNPSLSMESRRRHSAEALAKASHELAAKRVYRDTAAEVARVGKISARASQATAQALRSAGLHAGLHAVVRDQHENEERANAVVPVKRGPGFVDVNDDTFVRNGVGSLPIADGRRVSCTDSVSDFACSVLNKTYHTQGDMVRVEYPKDADRQPGGYGAGAGGRFSQGTGHAGASSDGRTSNRVAGTHLHAAAALTTLPLV